ncbi:hypothetical protein JQ628_04450 [Bradyrhizobium lablabi]|uniref:hypothetical protein n=1 Tax=Bradyrhizobium lablabi TaxID=722472 RepID=UPI001BAD61B3|nr:hypothetical protein [Bradyrhizobium lablabi]MBR1120757.1 hypothetical protein [Bradyrhizobium lablabi]
MYAIYAPYVLVALAVIAAGVIWNRDLASTTQVRIILGGAAAAAVLWTGVLLVLSRSDL